MKNTVYIPAEADSSECVAGNGGGEGRPQVSSDTPVVSLILGILDDLRQLLIQEMTLARDEFLEKLFAVKWTLLQLALALVLSAVGGLLLMIAGVHLFHAATGLPLWASYVIVGGTFVLGGWLWLQAVMRRFRTINFAPDRTLETIKETTIWLGKQVESIKT